MKRIVLCLAAVCALQADARADAAASAELARKAEELATAGDFVGAAAKYREAYLADPRLELMCNVGVAYHKAQDLGRAQLFLSRCLERGTALDAAYVAAVRGVLATVEASLKAGDFTPVDIVVVPQATTVTISTFGIDDAFIGSHLVWLPFGKHELKFRAEGYFDLTIEIETKDRETLPVKADLERKPAPKPIVPMRLRQDQRSKIPAIIASGFTLIATGYAIYAFSNAHSRADVAEFATRTEVLENDQEYIRKWNTHLGVSAALAVIGAGASGFFWYRALEPAKKVELTPTPSGATVTFRTTF